MKNLLSNFFNRFNKSKPEPSGLHKFLIELRDFVEDLDNTVKGVKHATVTNQQSATEENPEPKQLNKAELLRGFGIYFKFNEHEITLVKWEDDKYDVYFALDDAPMSTFKDKKELNILIMEIYLAMRERINRKMRKVRDEYYDNIMKEAENGNNTKGHSELA